MIGALGDCDPELWWVCAASVSAPTSASPSLSFLQALSKPPLVSVPCSAGLPLAAVEKGVPSTIGLPLEHPPVSVCDTHVGPPAPRCVNCVPGLFVCHLHIRCGSECFLCCPFCFKVQCFKHIYCECEVSVARRRFCAPRIAADAAGAAARRAALAALWAKGALHRAISATHRLEVAVRFSSLPLAVSASPTVEGEDHSSLSDYDVSLFSASQLFERVNLPETLPQYTTHQKAEQEVVFQALSVNIEPFPDIDIAL